MRKDIIEADLENIYQRKIPWEKLEEKTFLITGASGMLGSYLVFMLLYLIEKKQMKINIIALVRSKEKFMKKIGINPREEVEERKKDKRIFELKQKSYLKICAEPLDREIFIKDHIDFVIHAASLASPQFYDTNPIETLKPNVIGNYYLLELALLKKMKSYLYFSSGDIYGIVRDKMSIGENDYGSMDTLDIHNCYSESKRMAETMCKAYFHQKGIPIKIVRIWHTYSPLMDFESDLRVFASFVNDIVNCRNIIMKSDGSAKRSFCYVTDTIAACFLVLLQGKNGGAYNVCNSEEFYSISDFAEILVSLYPELGLKVEQRMRDETEHYVENCVANDIPPDNSKLKQMGWEAEYSVKEGFKRVIEYIKG